MMRAAFRPASTPASCSSRGNAETKSTGPNPPSTRKFVPTVTPAKRHVAGERDARRIRRPPRRQRNRLQVRQLMLPGAVVIHGPNLFVAALRAHVRQLGLCDSARTAAQQRHNVVRELVCQLSRSPRPLLVLYKPSAARSARSGCARPIKIPPPLNSLRPPSNSRTPPCKRSRDLPTSPPPSTRSAGSAPASDKSSGSPVPKFRRTASRSTACRGKSSPGPASRRCAARNPVPPPAPSKRRGPCRS